MCWIVRVYAYIKKRNETKQDIRLGPCVLRLGLLIAVRLKFGRPTDRSRAFNGEVDRCPGRLISVPCALHCFTAEGTRRAAVGASTASTAAAGWCAFGVGEHARAARVCQSKQTNAPRTTTTPTPPPNALGRSSTEPTTNPPTHRPPPHPRARRRSLCVSVAEVRKRLGHDDEMGYAPTAARCCEQSPGPDPSHTHTQVQQIIPAGGRSQRSNKHARSPPPPPCPCAAPTAPEPYQQQSQPQGDALAAAAAAPAGSPSSR